MSKNDTPINKISGSMEPVDVSKQS